MSVVSSQHKEIIYVPYEDWHKVWSIENKGIQLKYEDYLRLLQKQQAKKENQPLLVTIDGATYHGKIYQKNPHF